MDWLNSLRVVWTFISTSALFLMKLVQLSIYTLLRLALVPTSALLRSALVLFSPITFLVQYSLVPFYFGLDIIASLQPLYIFFACATLVGLITGTTLNYTSSLLCSLFELDDDSSMIAGTAPRMPPIKWEKEEDEDEDLAEEESPELDWAPLEKTWQEDPQKAKTRRRRTPGLLTQTILEEEDDS